MQTDHCTIAVFPCELRLHFLISSAMLNLCFQDAAMDEQFQPLCMQRYALSQLQFNLEKVIVTPVGGTMPFCWHHLLMQLPHLIHVFCLQLLFFQVLPTGSLLAHPKVGHLHTGNHAARFVQMVVSVLYSTNTALVGYFAVHVSRGS